MNRREFLQKSGIGFTTVGISAKDSASAVKFGTAQRPNILHIMSDMRRWDTMANRSICQTPNLNRLAAEGILFNRAYTATTPCCPARAMLATGSYHWHNGIYSNVHAPPAIHHDMFPDVITYYQQLRDSGYHMGYAGKWHASYVRTPLDFGFHEIGAPDAYNPQLLRKLNIPQEWKQEPRNVGRITHLGWNKFPGTTKFGFYGYNEQDEETITDARITEVAVSMIQRYKSPAKPWLIEVHFPPSGRFYPLKQYRDRYDPADISVPPSFYDTFENKPGLHKMEAASWALPDEQDLRGSLASNYAFFEQQDVQIGRILQALDDSGQRDNTLVTFSVDHGEMGGAHHMWGTGWMTYEENYHMPMCLRWPGRIQSGVVSDHLVQVHDLAHTYIDVAGAEPLRYRDGTSLLPLLSDPGTGHWNDHIYNAFYGQEFLYVIRMVVTRRHKYVFNSFDIDECYDLQEDPDELHNRINDPECKPIVDDLRARIYELMVQTEDPFGDNPPAPSGRRKASRALIPRYLPRGKRLATQ